MSKRLPIHQDLLSDLWAITSERKELERLLEHATVLQHGVIALASAHGVARKDLAEITELSGPRITQITDEVDVPAIDQETAHQAIRQLSEFPGDARRDANAAARASELDDPEAAARARRKAVIVYGEEAAARRYGPLES